MVDTPLISVIVPCFNHAHFLPDALDSILAQSYPHVEAIIVDDGSSDDTRAVAAQYPQWRYVRQANSGLSSARNTGIRHSSGAFLVFLDADDRLLPDALTIGYEELRQRPDCAFVSGDHRYIARDGSVIQEWTRSPIPTDHFIELLKNNFIGMCATVLYRRSAIDAVGGFDVGLLACEDYDLYLRIAKRFPVYAHNQLVAEYRRYGTAMSDDPARMLRAAMSVLRAQRIATRGDARRAAALAEGLQHWRSYYGVPLARYAGECWQRGLPVEACRAFLQVARYAPGYLATCFQRRTTPPVASTTAKP